MIPTIGEEIIMKKQKLSKEEIALMDLFDACSLDRTSPLPLFTVNPENAPPSFPAEPKSIKDFFQL